MFNKLGYIALLVFFFAGCKKDDVEFAIEPSIEFISIQPGSIQQYEKVIVTIKYEDGDGDLGENKDGVKNCFVTDNRIGITYEYRIQQLAPDNASIPITGNLNIDLGAQLLTDSVSQQSASYSIYVVDRAGHRSNSVTTTAVVISR